MDLNHYNFLNNYLRKLFFVSTPMFSTPQNSIKLIINPSQLPN